MVVVQKKVSIVCSVVLVLTAKVLPINKW